jgi:uncharacterized membrane protein
VAISGVSYLCTFFPIVKNIWVALLQLVWAKLALFVVADLFSHYPPTQYKNWEHANGYVEIDSNLIILFIYYGVFLRFNRGLPETETPLRQKNIVT